MADRLCRISLRSNAVQRLRSFMIGGARNGYRQLSTGTSDAGSAAKATLGTAGPASKAPHPSKKVHASSSICDPLMETTGNV